LVETETQTTDKKSIEAFCQTIFEKKIEQMVQTETVKNNKEMNT